MNKTTDKRSQPRGRRGGAKPVARPSYRLRRWFLLGVLSLAGGLLIWRAAERQILETAFLQHEGQRRFLGRVEMPAHRGVITDRHGNPLAVSTPVETIEANPRVLSPDAKVLAPLARVLGMKISTLRQLLAQHSRRYSVYLRRRVDPELAARVRAVVRKHGINGINFRREYRRYYPEGEVFAHVVGFTDVDDRGQEGLELAYDKWLQGVPGVKRVIRDGLARPVKDVESIRPPVPGRDLVLSLDRRLQYLAYRGLQKAMRDSRARSGSAVILDVQSGEILAMVNQPAYNPNGNKRGAKAQFRNRALIDAFEPGSTMKPFVVAAALESGRYRPESRVDTGTGLLRIGRNKVEDHHPLGRIDLTTVIEKSSNVGAAMLALDLPAKFLWESFTRWGFGEPTALGFPGELSGQLRPYQRWSRFEQATLSFGYSMTVTTLQLARAYAILAADGVKRPVSLLLREHPPEGERVMKTSTARALRKMLAAVVSDGGTAPAARIPGYRVGGKTGTVKKNVNGRYTKRYQAIFVGMAPLSRPRLVMAVMIDEPRAKKYYGGQVAAPVFSKVMAGALLLLNVPPDQPVENGLRLAAAGARQ